MGPEMQRKKKKEHTSVDKAQYDCGIKNSQGEGREGRKKMLVFPGSMESSSGGEKFSSIKEEGHSWKEKLCDEFLES